MGPVSEYGRGASLAFLFLICSRDLNLGLLHCMLGGAGLRLSSEEQLYLYSSVGRPGTHICISWVGTLITRDYPQILQIYRKFWVRQK